MNVSVIYNLDEKFNCHWSSQQSNIHNLSDAIYNMVSEHTTLGLPSKLSQVLQYHVKFMRQKSDTVITKTPYSICMPK